MQCPRCGCGVPDTKTECTYCGAPLPPPGSQQQHTPGGFGAHAGFGTGMAGDREDHVHTEAAAAPPEYEIVEDEPVAGIPGLPPPQEHQPAAGIPGLPLPQAPPLPQTPPANYLQPEQVQPNYAQPNYLQGNVPDYPPANYLQGNQTAATGGGEMRVSLTGEVMQAPPPPRVSGPIGAPPAPPPLRGPAPIPPRAGARASYIRPAREEAPASSGSGLMWGIILAVIVLIGAGAGGWYWYNNRTNPKDQAQKLLNAVLVDHDWKTTYGLVAMNAETKKKYPNADSVASEQNKQINANPMAAQIFNNLKFTNITTGDPTFNNGKADVPTSASLSIAGRSLSFHGTAHMVREAGIWKLDATSNDPQQLISMQSDLLKPDMGGGGGMAGTGGR